MFKKQRQLKSVNEMKKNESEPYDMEEDEKTGQVDEERKSHENDEKGHATKMKMLI